MPDILELHEFFVEGGNQNRSHVLLHISEPDAEEKSKGYFFAVCEINNGSIEQIEHLQQLIDDLESGYYETPDEPEKNSFEISLEYINRRGHHVLQYKNALTNCLVGVLRGHELFFAYHGLPQALLFYPGNQDLENLDVLDEQTEDANDQLFSSMMQGTLNSGDYFYIATPHINDYFATDRLKKIINNRNTKQTAEHIQKVLSDLHNDLSFGGILFHFPTQFQIPKSGKQPITLEQSSASSLKELANKEKITAETLSPSLFAGWKKSWAEHKIKKEEKIKKNKIEKTQKEQLEKNKILEETAKKAAQKKEGVAGIILVSLGKSIVTGISGFFQIIKKIILFIIHLIVGLLLLITNKDQKRAEVIKSAKKYFLDKLEYFDQMPTLSKIILLLTFILALIFAGSLIYLKVNANKQIKITNYNNQLQAIIDKKNAAEASLVYNDENKALILLREAKDIINNLNKDNEKDSQQISELNTGIEENLAKLRKVFKVTPELITDLKQTKNLAMTTKLTMLNGQLFIYGENDPDFYIVNPNSKQTEIKNHNIIPHLYIAGVPKEQDMIVFVSGSTTLAEYIKDTGLLKNADIVFPHNNPDLTALALYSRKLYIVDQNNNQIYKHNLTQTGFDKGTDWLKDKNIDLKETVSLALDGDVFVLNKSGEIIKLAGGARQEFNIQGLDPKLDNPVQIWTYNGVNNIYILEPTNKRIVILDKTGKLIKQITATEWQNPTSMSVDESKKTAYILDDNKVYKVNL